MALRRAGQLPTSSPRARQRRRVRRGPRRRPVRRERLPARGHRPDGAQLPGRRRRGERPRSGDRCLRTRGRRRCRHRLGGLRRRPRPRRRHRVQGSTRQRRPRGGTGDDPGRGRAGVRRGHANRRRGDRCRRRPPDPGRHGDRQHHSCGDLDRDPDRHRRRFGGRPRDRHRRPRVDAQDGGRPGLGASWPPAHRRPHRPARGVRWGGRRGDDRVHRAGRCAAHAGAARRCRLRGSGPGRPADLDADNPLVLGVTPIHRAGPEVRAGPPAARAGRGPRTPTG